NKTFGPDRVTGRKCADSKPSAGTIAGRARNAVAGRAHSPENAPTERRGQKARKWLKRPQNRPRQRKCPRGLRFWGSCGLNVQQILAGEFRLVGNEGEAGL